MDPENPELNSLPKQTEAGDSEAQYRAAIALEFGEGGQRDYARAFALMLRAAGAGHAGAQVKLSDYYDAGTGTAADPAQACVWAERAARAGSAAAAKRLSHFYLRGRGVDKDLVLAADWEKEYLIREARTDCGDAKYQLGNFYQEGRPGHPPEPARAYRLHSEAAACGHKGAMLRLAVLHERGVACVRDEEMAADWCDKALGAGSPQAARLRRIRVLRPSAEAGDHEALYELGMLTGGPSGEGLGLLKTAARRGSADAAAELLKYYSTGRAKDFSEAEITAWLSAAAGQPLGGAGGLPDHAALRAQMERSAAAGDQAAKAALAAWQAKTAALPSPVGPQRLAGEFPAPAGKYEISVSDKVLTVLSGSCNCTLRCAELAGIEAAWAVPARGGGYAAMLARFHDGGSRTLLQSEGYTAELAAAYRAAAAGLAAAAGVKYAEGPQGADA